MIITINSELVAAEMADELVSEKVHERVRRKDPNYTMYHIRQTKEWKRKHSYFLTKLNSRKK